MVCVNTVFFLLLATSYPTLPMPNGKVLRLELATNAISRAYGLMFRESLPKDMGMLFVFETCGTTGFWMKNCRFPLDIIFMDKEGKVLYIQANAPPCKEDPCPIYTPPESYCYVLEINGGWAEKYGIKKGVVLSIKEVLHDD